MPSYSILAMLLVYPLMAGKGPVVLPLTSVCLLPGYLVPAFVLSQILTENPNMVPGHQYSGDIIGQEVRPSKMGVVRFGHTQNSNSNNRWGHGKFPFKASCVFPLFPISLHTTLSVGAALQPQRYESKFCPSCLVHYCGFGEPS